MKDVQFIVCPYFIRKGSVKCRLFVHILNKKRYLAPLTSHIGWNGTLTPENQACSCGERQTGNIRHNFK